MRRILPALLLCLTACATGTPSVPTATVAPSATPVPATATTVPLTAFPTAGADEPIPCNAHDLVYHAGLRMVLLANCVHEGAAYTPDPSLLWGWDGAAWRRVGEGGPPGRSLGGVAYDSARDALLMLGGRSMLEDFTDFWRWDGLAWERLAMPGPGAVSNHFSMVYDPDRDRVVVFGGQDLEERALSETWEWDGQQWVEVASTGPTTLAHYALAYDAARQHVLLLGEGVNQLWAWDGSAWRRLSAAGGPGPRGGGRMAFHAGTGQVVVFGGFNYATRRPFGDTWLWDGAAWTEYTGPGPTARSHHALAYDPVRDRIVLYGGYIPDRPLLNDTWEWDGQAWSCVARCP